MTIYTYMSMNKYVRFSSLWITLYILLGNLIFHLLIHTKNLSHPWDHQNKNQKIDFDLCSDTALLCLTIWPVRAYIPFWVLTFFISKIGSLWELRRILFFFSFISWREILLVWNKTFFCIQDFNLIRFSLLFNEVLIIKFYWPSPWFILAMTWTAEGKPESTTFKKKKKSTTVINYKHLIAWPVCVEKIW